MSNHVLHQIADFFSGRLPDSARRAIEVHLKGCADCADDFTWAQRFRDTALHDGSRHLDSTRIVELSETRENATEAEAEHLRACSTCNGEMEWSESQPGPEQDGPEERRPPVQPARTSRPATVLRPRAWMGLAAILALSVALTIFLPGGPDSDLIGLARIEPLPVRMTRVAPEPGSFEEDRLLGLEAYAAGDFDGADEHLAHALVRRPGDVEILIYLGSSRLLRDRPADAADVLTRAADLATGTTLESEALWQLANAELADGSSEQAAKSLRRLRSLTGPRVDDASALLADMKAGK